jgi:cobalt/nickel transport system permease protein
MHIPDGFLDAKTIAVTTALSATGVGLALRHVRRCFPPHRIPLIGLTAAFVFVAQTLNFPVIGGTSGHLIGGALAAILVGPSAAVLVMTAVLVVQCLMFADGGVTALGANMFNMALVVPLVGYVVFRLMRGTKNGDLRRILAATAFAAWISTVIASLVCAGQLALSGTALPAMVFPAMAGIHTVIGVGEALISTLVLFSVARVRPDLLYTNGLTEARVRSRDLLGYGLLIATGLAVFVAPFASSWPDGLESVATRLGFDERAAQPILNSLFHGYAFPGVRSVVAATALAAAAGLAAAYLFAHLLATVLTAKNTIRNESQAS